jgi:hypothetical protein
MLLFANEAQNFVFPLFVVQTQKSFGWPELEFVHFEGLD